MVCKSERSEKIKHNLHSRLEEDNSAKVKEIKSRECSNDNFRGVQLKIYGKIVPVLPILEFVSGQESIGIDEFYHCDDAVGPSLIVFIAYIPEPPHPAFV